jgi:L-aminopeptidase/D-esterase-like protein
MSNISRRAFNRAAAATALAGAAGSSLAAATSEPELPQRAGSITDVPGIRVGHFNDARRPTGCTAILFDPEATAGVDYDGSAPGSHLGVLLKPVSPIDKIHGMLLTGGGPMALDAVGGVVRFLQERKVGFDWGIPNVRIPIVVGAVIDDLAVIADAKIRPDADAAYKACQAASSNPVEEGNAGIGAGATIGKMLVGYGPMKGGLGTASLRLGEAVIGALAVLNASGDVVDWRTGKIIAGARRADGKGFVRIVDVLKSRTGRGDQAALQVFDTALRSTTLVVVATNIDFTKTELTKLAMMASTGAARCINPYHTNGDGDSTFALSTNKLKSDVSVSVAGSLAAEVVSEAVLRAVKMATSIKGWPAYRDFTAQLH